MAASLKGRVALITGASLTFLGVAEPDDQPENVVSALHH